MEGIVAGLMSIAIFLAILYVFVKTALAPIHVKLDRVLMLLEASRRGDSTSESGSEHAA